VRRANFRKSDVASAKRAKRRAFPVLSCTTRGFSCPASCLTGGGLLPRLFTLTLSLGLTFPKVPAAGRSIFCDTFREPSLSARLPAYSTRRVAWWCSDFPLTPGSLGFPHICPKRTLDKSKAKSKSPCASDCLSPAATSTLRSFFDCARHGVEKSLREFTPVHTMSLRARLNLRKLCVASCVRVV